MATAERPVREGQERDGGRDACPSVDKAAPWVSCISLTDHAAGGAVHTCHGLDARAFVDKAAPRVSCVTQSGLLCITCGQCSRRRCAYAPWTGRRSNLHPKTPHPHPHPNRRLLCLIQLLPLDVVLLRLDVVAEDVSALYLSRHVHRHGWTRGMTTLYRPNQR